MQKFLISIFFIHSKVVLKITLFLGLLPSLPPTQNPLFQWYLESKEFLLNLGMKFWNSAFNAQGSRVIIVMVQVGAVKIYVAAVEELRKNERQDETQFTAKIGGKTSLGRS